MGITLATPWMVFNPGRKNITTPLLCHILHRILDLNGAIHKFIPGFILAFPPLKKGGRGVFAVADSVRQG
jgi:hypothetical protein